MNHSRARELVGKVPPITLFIIVFCVLIHALVFLFDVDLYEFTMNPRALFYLNEWFRMFSSAFLHASLMHIAMNMMSVAAIGAALEQSIGSLTLVFLILWGIVLSGVLFSGISWVVWKITDDPSWMVQNAVGFSGIIFTLAVVESYRSLTPTRSIFGFVQVPTRIYPWALMIVLQVMVPQISFMGHFSGLLVGVFYSYNCLTFAMPSVLFTQEMEDWRILSWLTSWPSFQKAPSEISIESASDLFNHASSAISTILNLLRNIFQALMAVLGVHQQNNNTPAQQQWHPVPTGDVERG